MRSGIRSRGNKLLFPSARGLAPSSALVRVRNKIKRPDVAPRIGTNIMMVMREGIANAMRASRRQEKQKLRLSYTNFYLRTY